MYTELIPHKVSTKEWPVIVWLVQDKKLTFVVTSQRNWWQFLKGPFTSGTAFYIRSQNHGIVWLQGTSKGHLFPNFLGWAGAPSTRPSTQASVQSMNNSRNGASIISLGNLCQEPFLCQDCQHLQKVGWTILPFIAFTFLDSKIILSLQDCTTWLFSTVRTTTYHQRTPNFSEMAKYSHNTDKNIN